MYPVAQEFLEQIRATKRRVYAKAVVDYTDSTIDQSIQVTATEQANVSYPSQTADAITKPHAKYASLDGSWVLGEDWALAPAPDEVRLIQMGWWGEQLANASGEFAEPYPSLIVSHMPRPIRSLQVVGDSARGEYPVDFTIQLFAQDDTLLYTETVVGNTEITWEKDLDPYVLDVAKQVLTITKWSHPGRQAKILEFFTSIQETYLDDDIMRIRLLEEREVNQGSLPVGNISANEIALTFNNETHKFDADNEESQLYNLLKINRKIRLWLGAEVEEDIEWVPLGLFWAIDWDTNDDNLEATVVARDRLELMRKTTYQSSQVEVGASLYDLAEQALEDAGLLPSDYIIDEALRDIVVPYAWFAPMSHRDALRLIAEAALAVVYADRDGKIRITTEDMTIDEMPGVYFPQGAPFPGEFTAQEIFGIGPDDYFSIRTPSKQENIANEIAVTTQPYLPASAAEEVYRSNEPVTVPTNSTITVTAYYNQPPVMEASATLDNPPAGVSIDDATYFAWGAEVSIRNATGSDEQVTLAIEGKPLTVQNKGRIVARDQISIIENGVMPYEFPDNHLIQTVEQAQNIANALLASAKDPRRDIEMEWRGNPALELGDAISVITDATRDRRSEYVIIRQEIEWAGSLNARLTGRRI